MFNVLIANREDYDTFGMQWLLQTSITKVDIKIVKTTEELIKEIEDYKPDLLILELDMLQDPLLPAVKKSLSIYQPSIIGLTIEATFNQAKLAIDIGVKELLLKPVTPEVILKTVRKIMREMANEKKKNHIVSTQVQSNFIQYNELFFEKERSSDPYIFIGIKTENNERLSSLYSFVGDYPFPVQLDCFALNDMVLCVGKKDNKVDWHRESKKLMMKWMELHTDSLIISINKGANEPIPIGQRFNETRQMMEEVFYLGFKQVVMYDHPPVWQFIDPFLTPAEQRVWIENLNQFEVDGIRNWLYHEFLHYKKPYPEPGLVRIRLTSLLAQIRRHMKTFQLTDSKLEEKYLDIFQGILYSPVIYKIIQDMILFISDIFLLIKNDKHIKQDLIEKTISYLEKNYWNDELSLEQVAEFVGRNSSYLSSKIAEKTGRTFRELLNLIRIREAKKLLMETDMSIKEISQMTGFKYQPYFQKVFKKYVFVSPNDYRREPTNK